MSKWQRKEKSLSESAVNGGSLERELLQKYGGVTADALVESAMGHVAILDELNF